MIAVLLGAGLACVSVQAETGAPLDSGPVPVAVAAPPSGGCASSCALDAAPAPAMTRADFEGLLATWATEPVGEPTLALETLLFHGPETLAWRDHLGDGPLDRAHTDFLDAELARDRVHVEMQVLDEHGDTRGTLVASNIPLAEKQHLTFSGTGSLGHLETGGKVKRVGLGHLWSRW